MHAVPLAAQDAAWCIFHGMNVYAPGFNVFLVPSAISRVKSPWTPTELSAEL